MLLQVSKSTRHDASSTWVMRTNDLEAWKKAFDVWSQQVSVDIRIGSMDSYLEEQREGDAILEGGVVKEAVEEWWTGCGEIVPQTCVEWSG